MRSLVMVLAIGALMLGGPVRAFAQQAAPDSESGASLPPTLSFLAGTAADVAPPVAWLSADQTPQTAPAAPPPPKVWTVTLSAGLADTSGNSNTSSVNAAYNLIFDPNQKKNVIKSDGLVLRGKTNGVLSANNDTLNIRDEYQLSARLSVFGQNQYLHDTFKEIGYLVAPTGGLNVKLVDTKPTQFEVSGGAGGEWEKDTGTAVEGSGAVTAAETFVDAITSTTTFNESITALWKANHFGDSLYTSSVSVAVSASTRTQLKLEAHDTFKNQPPPGIKKNDVALLVAFVYKM